MPDSSETPAPLESDDCHVEPAPTSQAPHPASHHLCSHSNASQRTPETTMPESRLTAGQTYRANRAADEAARLVLSLNLRAEFGAYLAALEAETRATEQEG